jgi:hypothetical protein
MKLRRHFRPATKDTLDPHLLERDLFAQRLEQLGSRKQALNRIVRFEQSQRLVDDMLLVLLHHPSSPILMSLITQRGSRSTQKGNPATVLRQMLDGQRSRRGPEGPSIIQSAPLGNDSSGSVSLNIS